MKIKLCARKLVINWHKETTEENMLMKVNSSYCYELTPLDGFRSVLMKANAERVLTERDDYTHSA